MSSSSLSSSLDLAPLKAVSNVKCFQLKLIVVLLAALTAAEENISTTEAVMTTLTSQEVQETTAVERRETTTPVPTTVTTTTPPAETEEQVTTGQPESVRPSLSDEDRAWILRIKYDRIEVLNSLVILIL